MPRSHRAATAVLGVAATLALITGCTNGTTPTPANEPGGTSGADEPAPVTPEGTGTAPGASPSASDSPTASGSPSLPATGTATAESINLGREDEHEIVTPGATVSITCSGGGDIDIDTDGTTVDINGDCEDIDIDGNDNTVTGETADSLDVEGTNNTVTLTGAREIDIDGTTNTITVGDTRDIDVEGDGNTVTYASGDPAVETEGNNAVEPR